MARRAATIGKRQAAGRYYPPRVFGVENIANGGAAQAALKNVQISYGKTSTVAPAEKK